VTGLGLLCLVAIALAHMWWRQVHAPAATRPANHASGTTGTSRIVDIIRGWTKQRPAPGALAPASELEHPRPSVRPAVDLDPLPTGFRFGPFLIEEELTPALMGRVYRARDVRLGRTVAVNVLAASLRDPVGRYRFGMSVLAASNASTSSEAVLEFGEVDGLPFVVVKYLEGLGPAVDVARVPWSRPTT
jgi:hypothetical protein